MPRFLVAASTLALLLAAPACGDDGGGSGDDESEQRAQADPEPASDELEEKPATWMSRELEPVEDVVDGVAFAVTLPAGVEREVKKADGSVPGYVTWSGKIALTAPTFTAQVVTFPPADLDAATRSLTMPNDLEVLDRREEDGDFFVSVAEPSGKFMHSQVWRRKGDTVVRFSVMHRTSEPMEDLDDFIAWSQKVTESFELR